MMWYKLPLPFLTCHLSDLYANYNKNHETLCGNSLTYKKQLIFVIPFLLISFFQYTDMEHLYLQLSSDITEYKGKKAKRKINLMNSQKIGCEK